MPLLQYKAVDERGKRVTGQVEAVNVADLEMRLSRLGLDLINYKEVRVGGGSSPGRIKREDLISFCFHMEQLLRAGVPMIDGLVDLRDTIEASQMREVIAALVESIEGGKSLSEALAEHPRVFDNVFVNLVRAGELSGRVAEVLQNITENLKWRDEQAALIKRLLMYPIIVGIVVMLVVFFLMTFLVPQLVSFITSMGQVLPLHTRILIAVSHFFVGYWYVVLVGPILLIIAIMLAKRLSPGFAYFLDALKLHVWVIGPILRKMILSRFANYFALLYASGITVLDCIQICEGLVGNRVIADATHRAGRQISDGASISAGFESTALFPPLVLRMLRVGESTGGLDQSLLNISYFYDRDVKESMQRLQTMIEPTMTVVLGGLLFWVAFSVLGPIYDLITKLKY